MIIFHKFKWISSVFHVARARFSYPLLICCVAALSGCSDGKITSFELPSLSLTREQAPAPVENAPLQEAKLPIPPSGIITVQQGDSLYRLANRYQISPQSIMRDNNLSAPNEIIVGRKLKLSPLRFHEVTITDSLYSLSQRYAISQYQLAQANELQEPYELIVGTRLILPDTLDFSVLDLDGLNINPAPQAVVKPALSSQTTTQPRKLFVAPALGNAGFTWPVEGEVITEFGPVRRGIHNDGINIKADRGSIVTASAPGTVAYIGRNLKSFGTLVLVKHEQGYITAYAHLDSINISEGDVLGVGTVIGQVGSTGRVDSPQLHFEIRQSRTPINPRDLIS